jgi:hypothetical protein
VYEQATDSITQSYTEVCSLIYSCLKRKNTMREFLISEKSTLNNFENENRLVQL